MSAENDGKKAAKDDYNASTQVFEPFSGHSSFFHSEEYESLDNLVHWENRQWVAEN